VPWSGDHGHLPPRQERNGGLPASATPGWSLFAFLVTWLYFALMESSSYQATNGSSSSACAAPTSTAAHLVRARHSRWFAKILSTLIFWIRYLMIAFTPRKRGLHDYIAGTLVYKSWALQGAATTPASGV